MQKGNFLKVITVFIFFFRCHPLQAQTCIADYFSIEYKGEAYQTINKTITSNNEIILAGGIRQGFTLFGDGFLSKLTPYGTVIWSKRFFPPDGYNNLTFWDVVSLPGGDLLVVGSIEKYENNDNIKGWGILLRIDKYGSVVWGKTMSRYNELVFMTWFTNIYPTNDGEYIIHGFFTKIRTNYNNLTYNERGPTFFIRVDRDGNVRWKSQFLMETFAFGISGTGFKQLQNGNLAFGINLHEQLLSGPDIGKIVSEYYYLFTLDYNTGERIWDKFYQYPSTFSYNVTSIGPVKHIAELPNGDLSFLFSFSDSVLYAGSPGTERSANMITTPGGVLQKVLGYYNTQIGCYTADAIDDGNNGERTVLKHDGKKPLLINMDKDGQIRWQKAYDPGANIVPQSLLKTPYGYYIFSNKPGEATTNLIKTDTTADMGCLNSSLNMVTEDVSRMFKHKDVNILSFSTNLEYFDDINQVSVPYAFDATTLCKKACCADTVDVASSKTITFCEGKTYTLPDNYIVKDSGIYNVAYKTQRGCDSIIPYHINILKNPASLSLGSDTCFEEKNSLVLKATAGFTSYNWMNVITDNSTYTVTQDGKYWVEVSNSCGAKRDSIEVFKECDFEIYMPNAFTPNRDGVNDNFGISHFNKNHLIKLKIFNCWGQSVFETSDINQRWDGSYHKLQQPSGIYLYFVEMEDLAGKRIKKRGTVALIR